MAYTLYVYLKNLEEQPFLHLILYKYFTFVMMIPFSNSTLKYWTKKQLKNETQIGIIFYHKNTCKRWTQPNKGKIVKNGLNWY